MKFLIFTCVLFCFLSSNGKVYAEGGTCPNGYYPLNSPGVIGCAPIPSFNNQQQARSQRLSPQWLDQWGAIAVGMPGAVGTISDAPSQAVAEQTAISKCQTAGGTNCKLQISYVNSCGVIIVGNPGFNAGNADTADDAIQNGMRICRDSGATNCHVYYSACSLPVRIR